MAWFKKDKIEEKSNGFVSSDFFGVASPKLSSTQFGSTLTSCVNWLQINITEADLKQQYMKNGQWVYSEDLPIALTNNPEGINLSLNDKIAAISVDLLLWGNAILLKLKNSRSQTVALQYMPWSSVNLKLSGDNSKIEAYVINNISYTISDIIHIRKGTDSRNPFIGYSIFHALSPHNSADYYASVYTSALIAAPTPSQIIVSKKVITQDQCDRLSRLIAERSSATSAGSAITLNGEFDFVKNGYTPDELNIQTLIEYTESRICALTGIPAQVLGLSVGNNPTYSNYNEAIKSVSNNLLIPFWELISSSITIGLQSELGEGYRLCFDYENINALQSDLSSESDRVGKLFSAGVISRAQAKTILGIETSPGDETIYA